MPGSSKAWVALDAVCVLLLGAAAAGLAGGTGREGMGLIGGCSSRWAGGEAFPYECWGLISPAFFFFLFGCGFGICDGLVWVGWVFCVCWCVRL